MAAIVNMVNRFPFRFQVVDVIHCVPDHATQDFHVGIRSS
jgi:hypothetical protein